MSRRNQRSNRGFARTDRIGSTLREIIGEELRRIDDDRVAYVTVTEVDVDAELTRARVYLSTLNLDDEEVEGVEEHTGRIRKAIARQGQLRRVPALEFYIDPGLRAGTRVDEILRDLSQGDRAFLSDSEEEE